MVIHLSKQKCAKGMLTLLLLIKNIYTSESSRANTVPDFTHADLK